MKVFRRAFSWKDLWKQLALLCCIVLLAFALPRREPLSFALFAATLFNGLEPFSLAAGYVLSSLAAFSVAASLSAAVQAAFLLLVAVIYKRLRRPFGWERLLYLAAAQLPFLFLFPHAGYEIFPFEPFWQKVLISSALVLCSLLFEGGLYALLHRAFRCRLAAFELTEIGILWLALGLGTANALGKFALLALVCALTLYAGLILKSAAAVPFSAALSLPLCVAEMSVVPLAECTLLSSLCLLFVPYGRIPASLALFAGYSVSRFFGGLYASDGITVAFTLLACGLPVIAACCTPEKLFARARKSLLFYRERTLPRIAINRNRRAVGEQLYEVSALFREIETSFRMQNAPDRSPLQLREKLIASLCAACPNRRKCRETDIYESFDKLIAVGVAKKRVNLIDMPVEISSLCRNSAGLLFALNRLLAEYSKSAAEFEAAREGRLLLAEQAHGISEILRELALEQSEEYVFSEGEKALSDALLSAGILNSEIFLYGEGANFTASMTLESGADGKKVCAVAGKALHAPLSLADKIPISSDRACFVLKRKPKFDATFGISARPKKGEIASGDTHSVLRIDERRFLVALSDGMGSGEEARAVSDRTLSLLESFYKAKMPSETVLGTVNRLVAFSSEESFSCLDVAAVDLDTGEADVVKIGSPAGFLLSGEELRVLEGESLPIGMLEAVHPATLRVEMKRDDFLIFMSDGVTAAFGSTAELCSFLSALHPLNPQALSEQILSAALSKYHGNAEDDMTVLAVKLTEAA